MTADNHTLDQPKEQLGRCLRCWDLWVPGHVCRAEVLARYTAAQAPPSNYGIEPTPVVEATPTRRFKRTYAWFTPDGCYEERRFGPLKAAVTVADGKDCLTCADGTLVTVQPSWAYCVEEEWADA